MRVTKDTMYNLERTNGKVLYETPYIEDTKIGIMYPSDLAYAAIETESCLSTTTLDDYEPCKASNWINRGTTRHQWLIVPVSNGSNGALYAVTKGNSYMGGRVVSDSIGVRPVLYLDTNVKIEGEGTSNSPFKLIP